MHNTSDIPIPSRMAHLPVWKGFPVPFTVFFDSNGAPDFAVSDEAKRINCIRSFKCGICGETLLQTIVFIGGPASVKSGMFFDPGMHEECARYASQVCPFIVYKDATYKDLKVTDKRHASATIATMQVDSESRPEKMALYFCRGFRRDGHNVQASKATSVEWIEGK